MLTDALSSGGLEIPKITGPKADQLKQKLFAGSSVANPSTSWRRGPPSSSA